MILLLEAIFIVIHILNIHLSYVQKQFRLDHYSNFSSKSQKIYFKHHKKWFYGSKIRKKLPKYL